MLRLGRNPKTLTSADLGRSCCPKVAPVLRPPSQDRYPASSGERTLAQARVASLGSSPSAVLSLALGDWVGGPGGARGEVEGGDARAAAALVTAQVVNVIVPESLMALWKAAADTRPPRVPVAPVKTPVPPTITSVSVPEKGSAKFG